MTTPTATVTPTQRQAALALHRQGQVYEAVELGSQALRVDPDDVEIRNALLAGYAKLGLPDLAAETAEGLVPEIRNHPEVRAAIGNLRGLPSARVPWTALKTRFDANLAVLVRRCPELALVREAWRQDAGRSVELYRCTDGNDQICRRDEHGLPVWWPKIADHHCEAAQLQLPNTPDTLCSPFLFEGMGTHCLLDRIHAETHQMFLTYGPALYVVETDPLWVAAVLHLHDWRELLAQDRVLLFVGPDAVEGFRDYLLGHDQSPIPGHRVRNARTDRDGETSLAQAIDHVASSRDSEGKRLGTEVKRLYGRRGPRFLDARFNRSDPAGPVRIMFLVSRFTTVLKYTIRDLDDACRTLGYPTDILTEETDFGCLSTVSYHRRLLDFQPDLVVIPDHIRAEYADLFPPQLVVTTWMQDRLPHLFSRRAGAAVRTTCAEPDEPGLVAPTDYLFGYFRGELVGRFGYPPDTYMTYPIIPSNPRVYRPVEVTPELTSRYGCEVAFLGHGGEPCEQPLSRLLETFEPAARPVVEAVFETARDRYRRGEALLYVGGLSWRSRIQELAESLASDMSVDPATLAGFEERFNPLNDRLWRHATLEWLVEMGVDLRLYGQGWDQHPVFARFARPAVNGPDEICAVYRCAKVNLQMGAYSAMHQRMINGLFAGGFFLIRDSSYNYGVFEYRQPDLHLGPASMDQRRAALEAMVELGRRGCDSFEEFAGPANRELVEALTPVVREMLRPGEPADSAAIWAWVDPMLQDVGAAVFPECWTQVTFGSRDELAERLDRFCRREPDRRLELAAYMRQRCLAGHGSERLVRRLLQHIGGRLAAAVSGRL